MTSADQGRKAGRGGLAVLTAKVFFIGTGLIQQALLPRAIGLADYGALSRVLAASNVLNNVVVSSSTQGVSRVTAAAGDAEREALRATLRVHGAIAAIAAGLLLSAAPFVAHFQHAPEVLAPLAVMTGVLFVYGVYAPLIGYLNGRQQFTRQAALDMVAATLRTAGLLGVGWLFARHAGALAASFGTSPGVLGATVGAVLAATGVFVLALQWTGTGRAASGRDERVPGVRAYVALILPIMVAQLFTNGLMQADIFLLGRYLSIGAVDAAVADPAKAANEWVAVYRACQLFAFLPYQLLFAVTQILFPMLAKAKAEEGDARVRELVARGCRIGAIVCGMLVCVIVSLPESLVKIAYGAEVASRAAPALRLLALGQAAFAMLGLATTILVSLGREKTAMTINALALGLLVVACAVSVPSAAFGGPQLMATAAATTCALALALIVAALRVRALTGSFIPWKTALRVAACVAGASFAGGAIHRMGIILTLIAATGVVVAYAAVLAVLGELGKDDVALLLSLARRRSER